MNWLRVEKWKIFYEAKKYMLAIAEYTNIYRKDKELVTSQLHDRTKFTFEENEKEWALPNTLPLSQKMNHGLFLPV
jgi:hypothetical protein